MCWTISSNSLVAKNSEHYNLQVFAGVAWTRSLDCIIYLLPPHHYRSKFWTPLLNPQSEICKNRDGCTKNLAERWTMWCWASWLTCCKQRWVLCLITVMVKLCWQHLRWSTNCGIKSGTNVLSSEFGTKFQEGIPLVLDVPILMCLLYNTASCARSQLVSTELWFVVDRWRAIAYLTSIELHW